MNEFKDGDQVKVRRLKGVFQVFGSRKVGSGVRYYLKAVPETGCLVRDTEAFGDDMELLPAPEPAPELALAPDPQPANSPAQELAADSPAPGSPADERSAAAAVCSPAPGITLSRDLDEPRDPREWDIPVDHTHDPEGPGEEDGEWAAGWAERVGRRKTLRYTPVVSIFYHDLKDILYSGKFKGFEDSDDDALSALQENTPVAVVATRERNGSAVWIVCVESELRKARLEIFYPRERGEEGMAIEHAVMLALRQVPIRTNDLEILLLQLGK